MKQGWQLKKMKDIAEYSIGLTYSPKDVSSKGTIVLRSSNIQEGRFDLNDVVRVNCKIKEQLKVKEGDILMCARNGSKRLVGKTTVIPELSEEMTFGTFMMIIRSEYNPYLSWFFKSDLFRDQITGGENPMINQVTRYMLDEVTLPVPPLKEQKRIVSILDEAFAAIDKAKQNAEKNLQNVKELYKTYLNSLLQKQIFQQKKLSEVATLINGRAYKQPELLAKGKYPVLRVGNFFTNNHWYFSDLELPEDKYCDKGDLLYAWSASFGPRIWQGEKVIYHYHIWKVVPNESLVTKPFLFYLLEWDTEQIKLEEGTGTTMIHVSKGSMENRVVPIPKLLEQQEIVAVLDYVRQKCVELEDIYNKKMAGLEELKKTILQKAFTGELTSKQVPEVV